MYLLGVGCSVHDYSGVALIGRDDVDCLVLPKIIEGLCFRLGEVGLDRLGVTDDLVDLDPDVIGCGLVQLP